MSLSREQARDLLRRLRGPAFDHLAACPAARLERAWSDTIGSLLDSSSEERHRLERRLAPHVAMTSPALRAGLDLMLGGAGTDVTRRVFARAEPRSVASPALVVLAATPVALAVQPLLPALARRRPLVLKSARSEPSFAPFLLDALTVREPVIGECYVALSWEGGHDPIERAVAEEVDRIVVYGDSESVRSFEERFGEKVFPQGPKLSIALIGGDGSTVEEATLGELARDVALFEQRGCLSLQLVLIERGGEAFGSRLARALDGIAGELPPLSLEPGLALEIQQLRGEAEMRSLWVSSGPPSRGSVIFGGRLGSASALPLRPSPGGRTVIVWESGLLESLLGVPGPGAGATAGLEPLRGLVQGVVIAGTFEGAGEEEGIVRALPALGATRVCRPGDLQRVDALWPNGGIDPLALY